MTDSAKIEELLSKALNSQTARPLHRVLFNLADCYNQAAELSLGKLSTTGNADFAAPAIMCRSFSIELLLKFFIAARHPGASSKSDLDALGINLHGHPYSVLFDRIVDPLKESIAQTYSERSGTTTSAADFRDILISLGDKPFVDWRYVYESSGAKHLNIALLSVVVASLGLAAETEVKKVAAEAPAS